jgi:hypothetical protein
MNQVVKLSTFDVSVRQALLKVFGMLIQPSALFRPNIMLRVIGHILGFVRLPRIAAKTASTGLMVYHSATNDLRN